MKIRIAVAGTVLTLAAFASEASAQCVTVDPIIVPDVRIDPLDAAGAAQVLQPLTLTFRRAEMGSEPIHVVYQILDEDTEGQRVGVSAGPQVEWRSGQNNKEIGASRNEGPAMVRTDSLNIAPGSSSEQVGVRLFVQNLREDLPAGVYREQFTVRYWCQNMQQSLPVELPGVIAVTVQVPNVLSASIAGASNHGQIDFLDFAALKRSLTVSVRSTGPYSVSARSLNGSVLLRDAATGAAASDRIPYIVAFGGRPIALDANSSFRNPRAGLGGLQIPLDVEVQDVSSKRAGEYSDTLVLTLSPVA